MKMSNICRTMYENFSKLMSNTKQKEFFDWMLAAGKSFKGRTLTRAEEEILQLVVSRKLYTPKLCFLQSQVGAMDRNFRYFEGQANTKSLGLPLEHAWLVDKEDRVWDPTWKDGDDYFGVEIPRAFVAKQTLETGRADCLLARYYLEVKKNEEKTDT